MKEDVVLDCIEDDLATEVMGVAHDWHVAAAVSDPWDTEGQTFERHRRECGKIYRDIGKLKLPWYKRWALDDSEVLVRLIKQFFAQEREPGFKEWRNKAKQEMRDRIGQLKDGREAMEKVGEAVKQARAKQKERVRAAHGRRKASRAKRSARA